MKSAARAFAQNPVFANIVLLLIFLAGYLAARGMTRETFPDFEEGEIQITVAYPGADPAEVEEGVSRKIEDAVLGTAGVKRLITESQEGLAKATVVVDDRYDPRQVLDQVRARVDGIGTFPADAEKPLIAEKQRLQLALLVALSSDVSERRLKHWAEELKEDLLDLPEVSQVTLIGARDFQVSVEVTEQSLRAYELTLAEVGAAIRGDSVNLPAGTVRTGGEEIRLRTLGRKYTGEELEGIIVRARPTGEVITLDQIATIRDGFADDPLVATLDGVPSVFLMIRKTAEEDVIRITDAVRRFLDPKIAALPPGARIELLYDMSSYLRARIQLLVKNGVAGLVLVFLVIWLFLDCRLSFWVGMGLPISIAGGLVVMWMTGQSINMLTLFALIMVLGLVVDDAIVVGEAIHRKQTEGLGALDAAVEGLGEVGWPVLAGVTTTMIAFLPLAFVSGVMGRLVSSLPIVVIACLATSLIEVIVLFPAHLGHPPRGGERGPPAVPFLRRLNRLRSGTQRGLAWFIDRVYAPGLRRALHWRYAVAAGCLAACLVMVGIVLGGHLRFELFGQVDGSILSATVELPVGTPLPRTQSVVEQMERAVRAVGDQTSATSAEPLVRHTLALSGAAMDHTGRRGPHLGSVQAVLADSSRRDMHSDQVMVAWEEAIGPIPGAEALKFKNLESTPAPVAIEIWLRGDELSRLDAASDDLMQHLRSFEGVFQVERSLRGGKKEIRFTLKPEARTLGLTVAEVAAQVQARFAGYEAVRIQRGREEVRVKVQYSRTEREQLSTLDEVRIRTPLGQEAPLYSVATATAVPGYASIQRRDGRRAVAVTAGVDSEVANTREILAALQADAFPQLARAYPDLDIDLEGENQALASALGSLRGGFPLAVVGIYVLIAAIFRSYAQPVVILVTVPLGAFGALVAHLLLGLDVTLLSLFGIVALAGVAVNDAIVMIEAINENLSAGLPFHEAVHRGGKQRFRAVLLTTLTTVGGLAPLILETDLQAQFLIPMAVAIAGGEMFGTILTVILVPVSFFLLNDLRCLVVRLSRGRWPAREAVEPARERRPPPALPPARDVVSEGPLISERSPV